MSDLIYKNQDALKPIQKLLDEADKAISDPTMTLEDSEFNELFAASGGIAAGAGIGFAGLFYGGSVAGVSAAGISSGLAAAGGLVGGGMAAGIGVLAAPAVVLGVGGVWAASKYNKRKLVERKETLLNAIHMRQAKITKELTNKLKSTAEREEYLNKLNILLKSAVQDLQADLASKK